MHRRLGRLVEVWLVASVSSLASGRVERHSYCIVVWMADALARTDSIKLCVKICHRQSSWSV